MYRTMIVAKMRPDAAKPIAEVFGESDTSTDLPALVGVRARSLFQFNEVYLHLIEGDRPIAAAVAEVAGHPAFRQISNDLRPYVAAYDPETWREPKDAMAHEFYRWERRSS
ncbi:TcmI family type II polyketide cyclase [Natronosporangium hydrolyticum]|uniref:TcmI family type II polyketide cyclase n=1 Tax=Natronosporangium hydrolyticum TaxID=2811111 RepID=A0A895YFI1_9ACTN|nr:TcmI family type II polyketide cyclase [Natronosporangium hydrolyticum]QSB16341.1 TcmI family type II polyketide cyclase [Natronosporangium hydrolyticum]